MGTLIPPGLGDFDWVASGRALGQPHSLRSTFSREIISSDVERPRGVDYLLTVGSSLGLTTASATLSYVFKGVSSLLRLRCFFLFNLTHYNLPPFNTIQH